MTERALWIKLQDMHACLATAIDVVRFKACACEGTPCIGFCCVQFDKLGNDLCGSIPLAQHGEQCTSTRKYRAMRTQSSQALVLGARSKSIIRLRRIWQTFGEERAHGFACVANSAAPELRISQVKPNEISFWLQLQHKFKLDGGPIKARRAQVERAKHVMRLHVGWLDLHDPPQFLGCI